MSKELHILILEDVPEDAELIERELRKGGIVFSSRRVETKEDFQKELRDFMPDIILADFSLPTFSGLSALLIVKKESPDVPFILVSGAIGEELAVRMLKEGATDYVLKSNLSRLVPTVNRALKEAEGHAERKITEERLQQSEEYFRALIENSSDVIIIVDRKGTIIYTSPSIERILGYKPKELIGKSGFHFILPADLPRAIYDFGKAIITKEVNIPNAFRVRHKDGSERILEGVGRNLFDNPTVEGFVMNARDISERKQAEAALRTSEAQLSNAMKIAKLGHWEYDVASDLFIFNDHFYAIFRTTAEEVGGYTMSSSQYAERFVHPADISIVSTETQKAIETNDPLYSRQLEHRIIYADGETGYITVRFFIVKDDQGKTVKTYGANQDITERKQAEEALHESEERYRTIFENTGTATVIIEEDRTISLANTEFEKLSGYLKDEIEGKKTWADFVVKDDIERMKEYHRLRRINPDSAPKNYEFRFIDRAGNIKVIFLTAAMIPGTKKSVASLLDMTDRKRIEEDLKKRVKELEDFYNMAVTRELKMIELKKEIEGLKEELSRYKRG